MGRFKSHLDSARRDSESDFQRALRSVGRGGQSSPLQLLGGNATASARIESDSRQRTFDAQEQYKHFRGQPYTSIKPICQRIAGQPIRLAMIQGMAGARNRGLRTREFDCEAPQWVKALTLKSDEEIRLVESHPVLDALNRPAPEIPAFTDWALKYTTTASLEITGAAYLWVRKVGGQFQVWPVPSHWVQPRHSKSQLFVGWDLTPDGAGDPIPLEREEIVPFIYPDPSSPMRCLGPLEAGARDIMVNECVVEAQKRMFQLGVHPTAIIKVGDAKLNDGKSQSPRLKQWQLEQVIQAINTRYRGMAHYGEPMILDRLISDIQPYGNKPHEMSFGENSGTSRERVEQCFQTNPYIVGAAGMGSRAESAEADRHFVYTNINPKIEMLSRVLTTVFLPLFDASGRYVLFIEPARPRDSEMEQKEWETALKYGTVTVNQYNSHVLRLPPIPGGDVALVPGSMQYIAVGDTTRKPIAMSSTSNLNEPDEPTPDDEATPGGNVAQEIQTDPTLTLNGAQIQAASNIVQMVAEGILPRDSGIGQLQVLLNLTPAQAEQIMGSVGNGFTPTPPADESAKALRVLNAKAFDDEFYDAYAEVWLKSHGEQESTLSDTVQAFLKDQGDDVVSKLESLNESAEGGQASADDIAAKVFDATAWDKQFREAIKEPFAKAVAAGAAHELKAFGDSTKAFKAAEGGFGFELGVELPPELLAKVKAAVDTALAQDYWADVQQTTKDQLAKALKDSITDGDAMRDTIKKVRKEVFNGDISKQRAESIARSESTFAMNAGQDAARQQLAEEDIVTGKEWFATYDGRTRSAHLDADSQRRKVDEDFEVGGHPAKYPGDPKLPAKQRINCRCIASSVTVFSEKRTRAPHVKSTLCRGCEIHGHH